MGGAVLLCGCVLFNGVFEGRVVVGVGCDGLGFECNGGSGFVVRVTLEWGGFCVFPDCCLLCLSTRGNRKFPLSLQEEQEMATNTVAEVFTNTLMADARAVAREIVSNVDFTATASFTKRNGVGYVIDVSDPEFMEAVTSPAFAAVMAEEGFYWERPFGGDTIVVNLESNMDEDE